VLLAAAAVANMACAGAQVRKEPPPQACPAGAVETMTRQLGLPLGGRGATVHLPGMTLYNHKPVPVKDGPVS
jgi:serine/threonine-protein kinase